MVLQISFVSKSPTLTYLPAYPAVVSLSLNMRFSAIAAVIGYTGFALAQTQLLPQCAVSALPLQCVSPNHSMAIPLSLKDTEL